MDIDAVTLIADPLERAAAADELMWAQPRRCSAEARELRRLALLQAVEVGRTPGEIAARLRVKETDVQRLTRALVAPAGWPRQAVPAAGPDGSAAAGAPVTVPSQG